MSSGVRAKKHGEDSRRAGGGGKGDRADPFWEEEEEHAEEERHPPSDDTDRHHQDGPVDCFVLVIAGFQTGSSEVPQRDVQGRRISSPRCEDPSGDTLSIIFIGDVSKKLSKFANS